MPKYSLRETLFSLVDPQKKFQRKEKKTDRLTQIMTEQERERVDYYFVRIITTIIRIRNHHEKGKCISLLSVEDEEKRRDEVTHVSQRT